MYLQIPRNAFSRKAPPVSSNKFSYEVEFELGKNENPETVGEQTDVNLPILATANDLREVVKFFKHKANGVSLIELTNAEPRRVFDARKIAAYEFWGIISRSDERLFLTALGETLAQNTEAECEIHRRILRQVPAYISAVEWIYRQRLKIATYLDVANFWTHSVENLRLSPQNEENIEAVIVSFFSLCHAAELGTATVGKRGQPARLSVRLDQIKAFLEAPTENPEHVFQAPRENRYHFEKTNTANINCVYVSAGARSAENLCAALELADFESAAFGTEVFEDGFLPAARMTAMRNCQAAIFLLDESDCGACGELRCDRLTEINVAQALFGERVVVLWTGADALPDVFRRANLNFFTGEESNWETNVKLVKCLKRLKC